MHSHGGITMNEISKLINNYNSFIEDLGKLSNDIYELVIKHDVEYIGEYWWPRERSSWCNKKTFACKYQNKNEVFYVGFNLDDESPYLLLERMYELKDCKTSDFNWDNDSFDHINNSDIKKDCDDYNIHRFTTDWGKCIYAKINLLEITSNEIVKTEVKSVIDYLFNKKKMTIKTIKLL